MSDSRIDFGAPATLRKWPSVNNERVSASLGGRPYMIIDGTLDTLHLSFKIKCCVDRLRPPGMNGRSAEATEGPLRTQL